MHNDVVIGLTGVHAEYIRSILDAEANSVAEELGRTPDGDWHDELEETLQACEFLVQKFTRVIGEGITRSISDNRRV